MGWCLTTDARCRLVQRWQTPFSLAFAPALSCCRPVCAHSPCPHPCHPATFTRRSHPRLRPPPTPAPAARACACCPHLRPPHAFVQSRPRPPDCARHPRPRLPNRTCRTPSRQRLRLCPPDHARGPHPLIARGAHACRLPPAPSVRARRPHAGRASCPLPGPAVRICCRPPAARSRRSSTAVRACAMHALAAH
jgi:hypothetical protein